MELIKSHARQNTLPAYLRFSKRGSSFNWERDFPMDMQHKGSSATCKLRLEFTLNQAESDEFKSEIKSNLNGTLPIEITLSKSETPQFKVIKQGPGSEALQKKSSKIAEFIGSRIDFTYIPAVRTADEAVRVVEEMVQTKLRDLEENPDYQEALNKIAEIQKPLLDEISKRITSPLIGFIPQVQAVEVRISDEARRRALRRCDIIIDDGTPTSIERKGDGVKSLAAISLLCGEPASNRVSILALEEPESHLHPGAIHRLRDAIESISQNHQVVITTHCPLFVNRLTPDSNIIIEHNSARSAKNIAEIRESLGVLASDNLMSASVALIVEGTNDKTALETLLAFLSPTIKGAIKSGQLIIDHLNGGNNLAYKASLVQNMLCVAHAFMDNDETGKKAVDDALQGGHLRVQDVNLANCQGMSESEFEDCLRRDSYQAEIESSFGIELNCREFRNKQKWSSRMKAVFTNQGKPWNNGIAAQLKAKVLTAALQHPESALCEHKGQAIKSLVTSLEGKLTKIK